MIPIALVGCAHIHTPKFAAMLLERDDIHVKAVWDHDSVRAARNAANLHTTSTPRLSSIWGDDDIQAVIICSETIRHDDLVSEALEARKHLFVEKPLAIEGSRARQMATAIEASGLLFSTGYFMRGKAEHRFLRDEIAGGRFGRLFRVDVSIGHAGALAGWFDDEWRWMTDPNLSGYGGFGDLATHGVDLILWLLGYRSYPVRVSAWTGSVSGRYGTIDEFGRTHMEFADGLVGSVWGSWVDLANPVQLVVSGTDAHASIVDGRLSYRRGIGGEEEAIPPDGMPGDLPHALDLFLDAIGSKSDLELVAPGDAAQCSTIIEASYRAAQIGSRVALARTDH